MSPIERDRLSGLYAIIDLDFTGDPVGLCGAVLRGGAKIVQLRAKNRDKGELVYLAVELRDACRGADALFIVNDHVDLALAIEADGVHVGQSDLPVLLVRSIVPDDFVVGCSTNTVDEARSAKQNGADYIGVGAMYPTASKGNTREAGIDRLREIRLSTTLPIAAIGGITTSNAADVVAAGADMISVIGALARATDPEEEARIFGGLFAAKAGRV